MNRILDGLELHSIAEHHLASMQSLNVSEDNRLDFKALLKLTRESDRKEFCKDISSMANTQGGYILFGVAEKNGIMSTVPGIEFNDEIEQQMFQVATSGVSPRLQAFDHVVIPLKNGLSVVVLKMTPDGILHQVKYGDNRHYKRTGTITIPMDGADLESFFRGATKIDPSAETEKRVTSFHDSIRKKTFFGRKDDSAAVVASVLPVISSHQFDLWNNPSSLTPFPPMYCSGWNTEVTGNARYTVGTYAHGDDPYSVTEITSSGEVRAFTTALLDSSPPDMPQVQGTSGFVPSVAYEQTLIEAIHKYLASLLQLGVSGAIAVNIALIGVKGFFMYADRRIRSGPLRLLEQNDVIPETTVFDSSSDFATPEVVAQRLKPAFDFIWREFGFSGSQNYTTEGLWRPR